MANWKQKTVSHAEWVAFQDRFEAVFEAKGAPSDWALFSDLETPAPNTTLLLTPAASLLAGADWFNAVDQFERSWALLVGHQDAHGRFGLKRRGD